VPPFGEQNTITAIRNIPGNLPSAVPLVWSTAADIVYDDICATKNCVGYFPVFSNYFKLPIDTATTACRAAGNCGSNFKIYILRDDGPDNDVLISPTVDYLSYLNISASYIQASADVGDSGLTAGQIAAITASPPDLMIVLSNTPLHIQKILSSYQTSSAPRPQMIVAVNMERPASEGGNFVNEVPESVFAAEGNTGRVCTMFPSVWDQEMADADKDLGFGLSITEFKTKVGSSATKYTAHIASGLSWLISTVAQPGVLSSTSQLYLVRTQGIPNVCAPRSASPKANHISAPWGCDREEKECRSSTWKMNIEASGKPTKPYLMEQATETAGVVTESVRGVRDINWFYEANAVLSNSEYPLIQKGSDHFIYGMERVDHPLFYPLTGDPHCTPFWGTGGGRRLGENRSLADFSALGEERLSAYSGASGLSHAISIYLCSFFLWKLL
jgi:hypothetical protein